MHIRQYKASDAKSVKNIAYNNENCSMKIACAAKCDYFIDNEPKNCLVITDEFDNPVGAILCSTDREKYLAYMPGYLDGVKRENRLLFSKYKYILKKLPKLEDKYGAYFNLTVLPSFRDKGAGRQLVGALVEHLKALDVKGMCTLVDSPSSLAFCERLGFKRLLRINSKIYIYGLTF